MPNKIDRLNYKPFLKQEAINKDSLTYNSVNLEGFCEVMGVKKTVASPHLRWADMMCNKGRVLAMRAANPYDYIIGFEPAIIPKKQLEYPEIKCGVDVRTVEIFPSPTLITSRYGLFYAPTEIKKDCLLAWYDLLAINGVMSIFPLYKSPREKPELDEFILATFKHFKLENIGKDNSGRETRLKVYRKLR